jgi:site-specific DNA-methyltransferase (adenine-specific)
VEHERDKKPFLLGLGAAWYEIKDDSELPRRGGIQAIRPLLPRGCSPPYLNRCAVMWDGHRTGDLARGERLIKVHVIPLRNTLEPWRSAEIVDRFRSGELQSRRRKPRHSTAVPIAKLRVDSNGDVTFPGFGSCMLGDCVERLKEIPSETIDHVFADPTFGVPGYLTAKTEHDWDRPMDWQNIWPQLLRVVRHNGNIVICAAEPLSSLLRVAQLSCYQFDWKWARAATNVFANNQARPLNLLEDILVFSRASAAERVWHPQMQKQDTKVERLNVRSRLALLGERLRDMSGFAERVQYEELYPHNVLFSKRCKYDHPHVQDGQKHVDLMRQLIRSHSDPGDVILDFCFGSNTTGIAAWLEDRKYIGIEKDRNNFKAGVTRLHRIIASDGAAD